MQSQSEISVFKYGLKLSHTEKMRIKANANETLAIKKSNKNNEDSSFLDSDQNLKASESFSFSKLDMYFRNSIFKKPFKIYLEFKIGSIKALFHPSKIKELVEHAGRL